MSLIKVHRERASERFCCHNMTTGFHFRRPDHNSAQCVKSYQKSADTRCPSSDYYANVLTYTPGNANTQHYSTRKPLGSVRYGVLEPEWGPFSLQWSWWWSPSQRWCPSRGESVYLHPFITICLMAYECLHGYSKGRERDGWVGTAPIVKVASQQETDTYVCLS